MPIPQDDVNDYPRISRFSPSLSLILEEEGADGGAYFPRCLVGERFELDGLVSTDDGEYIRVVESHLPNRWELRQRSGCVV